MYAFPVYRLIPFPAFQALQRGASRYHPYWLATLSGHRYPYQLYLYNKLSVAALSLRILDPEHKAIIFRNVGNYPTTERHPADLWVVWECWCTGETIIMSTVSMRKLLIMPCLVTRTWIEADFDPYRQRHRTSCFMDYYQS